MKFDVKNYNLEKKITSCIIIGIFESYRLSKMAKKLDIISNGYISSLLQHGELEGKISQTWLLYHVPNILSKYVLLIGCGKERELNEYHYKQIIHTTIKKIYLIHSQEIICFLTELNIKKYNIYWKIRHAIEIIEEELYLFNQFKTNKNPLQSSLKKIIFNVSTPTDFKLGELAIQHGIAISIGIEAAKNLSNMPPNICNPAYLALQANTLADNYKNITTTIINEIQMKDLAMNAYLAVGQGSKNETLMSIIEYKGINNITTKPIVLIGKGLTFDSGGISIKPSNNMNNMKYDMCGAASVYGIMCFIAKLQLPINVIGILAGCENMPGSKAFRPGDIITTMSGKTIEIINTDAEGRLVLCDILTYVERFNPDLVIDIATLTGACVIALGNHYHGLMSNNNILANKILKASQQSGDKTWRLPLDKEFYEALNSNCADLTNTGGYSGGAITAGCFLENFVSKYHWAHLDIAGTAWKSNRNNIPTGRPVKLIAQFLLNKIYKCYN